MNECHEDTCLKDIGLHLQVLLATPYSMMKISGGPIYIYLRKQHTCTSNNLN